MTDYVELNNQQIPVVGYKYVIDKSGSGLSEYPAIQYRNAEKERIKESVADNEELEVREFEALVNLADVKGVIEE